MKISNLNVIKRIFLYNFLPKRSIYVSRKLCSDDKPVKYSTSNAKNWDSINSFMSKTTRTQPASQPFIVVFCSFIFFVYFALLREENELDRLIEKPLEDTVPNIKEMTLRHQILTYQQMGLDTRLLREALAKELELK